VCPSCSRHVGDEAACPHCGEPLSPAEPPSLPRLSTTVYGPPPMDPAQRVASGPSDRGFFVVLAIVCGGALSLLAWLLVLRSGNPAAGRLAFMPRVDAALNGLSAALIVAGFAAIKRKRADLHKRFMLSAFGASALFLVCYVTYHAAHGDTTYPGTGAMRAFYL